MQSSLNAQLLVYSLYPVNFKNPHCLKSINEGFLYFGPVKL
jgi:hypothetical protein